ncbi:MAG TPA: RNHCP domain-containing protein [Anaerolineales bacterium]|nr:RNHCP domain-containing protein [Anaerolineales bacterium]
MRHGASTFGDFTCGHCHAIVSSAHFLSGVNNRNHCPYCLWSCHLDLYASGDRLSACKGQMRPIGLTMKKGRNKYAMEARGELMLVHECTDCSALSINRIAADDDASTILAVFRSSVENRIHTKCEGQGILALRETDAGVLHKQLFGEHTIRTA